MAKLGQPEDIGWTAAYLSSPAAGFITGAYLRFVTLGRLRGGCDH